MHRPTADAPCVVSIYIRNWTAPLIHRQSSGMEQEALFTLAQGSLALNLRFNLGHEEAGPSGRHLSKRAA